MVIMIMTGGIKTLNFKVGTQILYVKSLGILCKNTPFSCFTGPCSYLKCFKKDPLSLEIQNNDIYATCLPGVDWLVELDVVKVIGVDRVIFSRSLVLIEW